jgi:alkanesulfonate monooxygenase SsuD/methylene tetrahydromethanopterin reductase-like flavin-dependent oxidoreductase (luciferase family)
MLGIGAAWNEEESRGLGLFFPPMKERFERLEEALQICGAMWSGSEEPFSGRHYRLERTLNVPQPLQKPHPPIMIGGGGERKTLWLVARYGDSCNLFAGADLPHKLDVLRRHCEAEGRNYDEIEKTVLYNFDPGERGERVPEMLADLRRFAELGFTVAHGRVAGVGEVAPLEILGRELVPAAAEL